MKLMFCLYFDDGEIYTLTSSIDNTIELNLITSSDLHEMILDSSASFLATSNKDWFENLHKSDDRHIVLCDNFAHTIAEIGDATLKFGTCFVYIVKRC